jgi:hypothetical protein
MLRISLCIKNPWAKDVQLSVYEYNKRLTKHKHFEAEYYYSGYFLFKFMVDTSWRAEDHAGPEFELTLFGYSVRYKLYDNRHWNYEHGRWMTEQELEECYRRLDNYI